MPRKISHFSDERELSLIEEDPGAAAQAPDNARPESRTIASPDRSGTARPQHSDITAG